MKCDWLLKSLKKCIKSIKSIQLFQGIYFAFAYMYAHIQAHGFQMHFNVQSASKRHLYFLGV